MSTYSARPYGNSVLRWAADLVESGDQREEAVCIRALARALEASLVALERMEAAFQMGGCPEKFQPERDAIRAAIARARGDK
jgi:hypothetical protein